METHKGNHYVLFQFTPLREGRQGVVRAAQQARISIHAPPRGATIPDDVDGSADFISIHAPPRGATPARFSLRASCTYFNSRPSARGDGGFLVQGRIHLLFQFTPLREGRRPFQDFFDLFFDFNSRPSARGDGDRAASGLGGENFNSRPSARGDGKRYAISANLLFNPYKSAWLNNSATQFVEIILVIFHRIIV